MTGLRRPPLGGPQITVTEFSTKEGDAHAERKVGQFGIVTVALVAQECVGSIEFMPGKVGAGGERRIDPRPSLRRDMGILAPEDHEQLSLDFAHPIERIVIHSLPKSSLVNISRIEADRGIHLRIHGRPE